MLPSEAQWEYACRAGASAPFYFGDSLTSKNANFNWYYPYGNIQRKLSPQKTLPVGEFTPNAFGLFDTHGNVFEWCRDVYDEKFYSKKDFTLPGDTEIHRDPFSASGSDERVIRGGSWNSTGSFCRSSCRSKNRADTRGYGIGFRCVFNINATK